MNSAKKVSELFEAIKARPLVYLGAYAPDRMISFLHGFYYSYEANELKTNYRDSKNKVLKSRGWKVPAVVITKQMERKGLTNEEMIRELLEIEIETWKLIENETQNSDQREIE